MVTQGPGLCVEHLFLKAFIQVDLFDTEAAGAHAAVQSPASIVAAFEVNRPVLFALRDIGTGLVLFQGRVTSPS